MSPYRKASNMAKASDEHVITIGSSFLDFTHDVHCSCGFEATNLGSEAAAHAAVAEHRQATKTSDDA